MRKTILYLFCFLAIQFVVSWVVWIIWMMADGKTLSEAIKPFVDGNFSPDALMMIVASGAFSFVTILVFTLTKWAPVSRNYLLTRPWGVFFWCVILSLGTIIPSVWLQEKMPELPNWMQSTFDGLMSHPVGYLFVGIFAPLAEEIVFRGAILRVLLNRIQYHWIAIAVSALLFALAHGNPAQMPHAFLIGLLLGWLFYRTGSILPGVVLHWTNNTVAYVLYNLYPMASDMKLVDVFKGSELHVYLALLFSLFLLGPALFQLHLRMKPADK